MFLMQKVRTSTLEDQKLAKELAGRSKCARLFLIVPSFVVSKDKWMTGCHCLMGSDEAQMQARLQYQGDKNCLKCQIPASTPVNASYHSPRVCYTIISNQLDPPLSYSLHYTRSSTCQECPFLL